MKYVRSLYTVITFAWNKSQYYAGRSIWLFFIYRCYKNIHPIINAYFIKLVVDELIKSSTQLPADTMMHIALFLGTYWFLDVWDNFSFRHSLVISRVLQRRIVSGIESDLAVKHAALPITLIEDPMFKDNFALVKRESGFRLFPLIDNSVDVIAAFVSFLVIIPVMLQFEWWYLLIMLLVQIPRIITIKPALTKITHQAQVNAKYSRYWDVYLSFLENPRASYESRILQIKDHIKHQLGIIQDKTLGLFEKTEISLLPMRVITAVIPNSSIVVVGYSMALKVVTNTASIGDWQFVVNTCGRFSDQLKMVIDDIGVLAESVPFVVRLVEILNLPEEQTHTKTKGVNEIVSLTFENVWFRYPHSRAYALRDVSFTIHANENIAIVGHNGAGKTTLIKLLCRFYVPTKGKILINGKDIQSLNIQTYWKLLSAVFQEFESYGVSAYDSIGYGDIRRISQRRLIRDAAEIVGIDRYLCSLPLGYETPLIRDIDNGVGLSTGQWQKVVIARALFRKSKLIILDEPTSNLDPESEEKVFNQLIKTVTKRMMILISHRFSTVRRADRILVFEKGLLAEEGDHSTLMSRNGLYARLFRLQSKRYQE
ncbi:ABC transporter ATP-binding protein [candidate division WWE3 bacterium]|nr:ABC transporter ATP-binding protein [candidate division WWE3 bacterium]